MKRIKKFQIAGTLIAFLLAATVVLFQNCSPTGGPGGLMGPGSNSINNSGGGAGDTGTIPGGGGSDGGDTKPPVKPPTRQMGGDGYTGKLFVTLGTCPQPDAVQSMARIEEDGTATILVENCLGLSPRNIAKADFAIDTSGATPELAYRDTTGTDVQLPNRAPVLDPNGGDEKYMAYKFKHSTTSDRRVTTDQFEFAFVVGRPWQSDGTFWFFKNPSPSRIGLFRCVTRDNKWHFVSPDIDCEFGMRDYPTSGPTHLLGYYEGAVTDWSARQLVRCAAANKGYDLVDFPTKCLASGLFADYPIFGYIP